MSKLAAIILIPGLLLSPVAALGHVHDEHGRRHVHLSPVVQKLEKTHHHDHGHFHHDHHDDSIPQPATVPEPIEEHDFDTLVATQDTISQARQHIDEIPDVKWIVGICEFTPVNQVEVSVQSKHFLKGSVESPWQHCALYVRHLTLLI